jgi:hypothetical protein
MHIGDEGDFPMTEAVARPPRSIFARQNLFVATILTGSFLLFLIQPMVARFALPVVGGAPNVWNSAMVVFQLLLLGGYLYSHAIAHQPMRRQIVLHLALLVAAALTLPIALYPLPSAAPGWEALWVPALFLLSIGPVFFMLSSQASLMQRWFAASPEAGDPYVLYGASNLGSFGGLIAYPLIFEPTMPLATQSHLWSAGFVALIAMVGFAGWSRWHASSDFAEYVAPDEEEREAPEVTPGLMALWLALAAVPSGLMLSTTTLLTTDIMAAPMLWVIPLGLYLLSFSVAFSEEGTLAGHLSAVAPITLLFVGALALSPAGQASMEIAIAMAALLFLVAVALHKRLFDLRPDPRHLTLFYLMTALGGAIGGVFCALIAPLVFDWIYEHAILLIAAAMLLRPLELPVVTPLLKRRDWRSAVLAACALVLTAWLAYELSQAAVYGMNVRVAGFIGLIACIGLVVASRRALYVPVLAMLMLGHLGWSTIRSSLDGDRARSYFGAYHIENSPSGALRYLTHGTTLHGQQFTDPAQKDDPTSYYGTTSGIGIALQQAPEDARVGIVGLGVGTLACYRKPAQQWVFYEIDRQVVRFSEKGEFSFLSDCTPDARIVIGDARIALDRAAHDSLDLLAIDAFSSDAIPVHLLTQEAFDIYGDALAGDGLLLVHVSNRYLDLAPMVAALAKKGRWHGAMRTDTDNLAAGTTPSLWIALTRDRDAYNRLVEAEGPSWAQLPPASHQPWTDDNASILPLIRW